MPFTVGGLSVERMTTLARSERTALADLMLEVGPDAPTLSGDWTTRDLAAHLILRESRPDAAIGILSGPFASYTAKVQAQIAAKPWGDIVETVRNGPPRWSPQSIERLDAESNTVEYFVHHEDVRRAVGGWQPRELTTGEVAQLWPRMKRMAKLIVRKSPVGIVVVPSDGPDGGVNIRLKDGDRDVVISGPSSELSLAIFGRVTQGLTFEGSVADIEAFGSFPR